MTCGRIAGMTDQAALSAKRIAILVEEDFEDRELPLLIELLRETPLQIVVVGPVTTLRRTLRWFDTRPLFGKRVLVTRPRGQAAATAELLVEAELVEKRVVAQALANRICHDAQPFPLEAADTLSPR